MSLFAALSTTLTGLKAQSSAVNSISNNITNLDTTAFKSSTTSFANIVTGLVGGGVTSNLRNDIDVQGAIQSTGISTDLAIQGKGFFVTENSSGGIFYTRAGSFRPDANGNLVNESGFKLMGWPLDSEERLPGEPGNMDSTSNQDIASLLPVSTSSISRKAAPTTQITASVNLKAEQPPLEGSGAIVSFNDSAENTAILSNEIIVPSGSIASGDLLIITPGIGNGESYSYGGFAESFDISQTSIGGASDPLSIMSDFSIGDSFTISSTSIDIPSISLMYNSPADVENNEFSNLNELAQVIDSNEGFISRVANNQLYVSLSNSEYGINFSNVSSSGLIEALGLSNVPPASNRFSTLSQLAGLVNKSNKFRAELTETVSSADLKIYNIDPADSITFSDSTGGNNYLISEFGLPVQKITATYDPSPVAVDKSMASGKITSDFSRTISIYSSLGEKVDLQLAFKKIFDGSGLSRWGVELFSTNANDVIIDGREDGLLAYGTVTFNGGGTIDSISDSLLGEISINPSGGSSSQNINLSFGRPNESGLSSNDGLTQFAGNYSVEELSQNGYPTGSLEALEIDSEGFVTAIFSNSITSRVYKLPIAKFDNPNGLTAESGNAFSANYEAGEVSFNQVGDASVGTIIPYGLELSTVDISDELTKLIVSQQGYTASGNVLRKINELFKTLENL